VGERTQHEPGTFSWADLATTDPDGAKAFYSGLLGWETEDSPVPGGGVYTMCRIGGRSVAAIAEQQPEEREQGIPPHWNCYVTVASADDAAGRAAECGGTVVAEPFDVMEAGRMAVFLDPVGAALCVWEPRDAIGAELVNEPGALTWTDMATREPETAVDFYGRLFGWAFEKVDTDQVDYWTIMNGERRNGGIMRAMMEGIPPAWLPYFVVEDVEATTGRAEAAGGGALAGPIDVPSGRFAVLRDARGAVFGVLSGDLDD
jgi:predicted enzyme related to lactoylglutathione lyase